MAPTPCASTRQASTSSRATLITSGTRCESRCRRACGCGRSASRRECRRPIECPGGERAEEPPELVGPPAGLRVEEQPDAALPQRCQELGHGAGEAITYVDAPGTEDVGGKAGEPIDDGPAAAPEMATDDRIGAMFRREHDAPRVRCLGGGPKERGEGAGGEVLDVIRGGIARHGGRDGLQEPALLALEQRPEE